MSHRPPSTHAKYRVTVYAGESRHYNGGIWTGELPENVARTFAREAIANGVVSCKHDKGEQRLIPLHLVTNITFEVMP